MNKKKLFTKAERTHDVKYIKCFWNYFLVPFICEFWSFEPRGSLQECGISGQLKMKMELLIIKQHFHQTFALLVVCCCLVHIRNNSFSL